jgi:hypothetical protein
MLESNETPDEDRLSRLEAALRQRFVEVKRKLRTLARDAGLL